MLEREESGSPTVKTREPLLDHHKISEFVFRYSDTAWRLIKGLTQCWVMSKKKTQHQSHRVQDNAFSLPLAQCVISTRFRKSIIIPASEKTRPACLKDDHPVALTSVVMKWFEQLVKDYIRSSLSAVDPLTVCLKSKPINRGHHSTPWYFISGEPLWCTLSVWQIDNLEPWTK